MGFYDTVYCDYPLPDSYAEDYGFQTKDFDCLGKKQGRSGNYFNIH